MRILILGHKGMLGSDLMLRLARVHDVAGRDVDAFDIVSESDCRRVVQECSPEVVINAAAYTNVDGCETNREMCFGVNALGVKNVALACRGRGIMLVHFSTDYVFDGRKRSPYREEDPPAPLNVYGASKL
jgi:dTDP-4-dehydrorhamnose reductase